MRSVCEEQNFQEIYRSHAKPLRNYLYYKSGDLEKAEDLSQEALIRLWENCKEVIFEKAKSYLYTIAHRLMLDHFRHQKVVLEFVKESPAPITNQDPDFTLREKEFESILEKAIAELPEGQREAFLMNRIDKMSYAEIAETLGISVKAVEKRMHLALHSLKDKIKELGIYKF
ncbi:MAG TPA: sigma-70 family RNA polymerase sigma factor [Cytophagaceae bacterium]|jgi:RNA polymerase sigma-70 factor (ECF subfamily)|nr:sigma-70 family RNA polymerase sigma factor [Cytophagaceae bacterium]